jgi:hypothetical protein
MLAGVASTTATSHAPLASSDALPPLPPHAAAAGTGVAAFRMVDTASLRHSAAARGGGGGGHGPSLASGTAATGFSDARGRVSDRHEAQRMAMRNLRLLRQAMDAGVPISLTGLTRPPPPVQQGRAAAAVAAEGIGGTGGSPYRQAAW